MKQIYMSLSIGQYSYRGMKPECNLYQKIDGEPMTCTKLDYADACRIMWELVLAGATRKYEANMFNSSISHVDVTLWTRH